MTFSCNSEFISHNSNFVSPILRKSIVKFKFKNQIFDCSSLNSEFTSLINFSPQNLVHIVINLKFSFFSLPCHKKIGEKKEIHFSSNSDFIFHNADFYSQNVKKKVLLCVCVLTITLL